MARSEPLNEHRQRDANLEHGRSDDDDRRPRGPDLRCRADAGCTMHLEPCAPAVRGAAIDCSDPACCMNDQTALRSLLLGLPSPAYLFGAFAFGLVGFAAYRRGKKAQRVRTKWLGVALMLYPYAVSMTWLLYAVGIVLCLAVVLDRG